MDSIMLIGIVIVCIGLFLKLITAKWSWVLGGWYKTRNRPLSMIGWFLIIIGLAVIILQAIRNGQM